MTLWRYIAAKSKLWKQIYSVSTIISLRKKKKELRKKGRKGMEKEINTLKKT